MRRRVVVTGMGWVTPLGSDIETVWRRLLAGESGVGPITHFDAANFPTQIAAEVRDWDLSDVGEDPEQWRLQGVQTRFAVGAAKKAIADAGIDQTPVDPLRLGVYLGSGEGPQDFDQFAQMMVAGIKDDGGFDLVRFTQRGLEVLHPVAELEQEPNMAAAHLASLFDAQGPNLNCLTACAASSQAIGEATEIIRRGEADVMISGGTHTMIHVLGVTGFSRLTALSSSKQEDITKVSRPFDRQRSGFVMGEGAGVLVLETLEHAQQRGAEPLAEITGYGSSADAYRITDMHPEGMGPAAAILQALAEAGLDPHAVDQSGRPPVHYVSAHGTGTQENDVVETLALKAVFGDNAAKIPVSSIKSMMGHLIAAAGAVELITCILAIRDGILPPTINLLDPDTDLDLDYVPNAARPADVEVCLSDSFGFGGQNDTLIVRKFKP